MLSDAQVERYARQIVLPEVGGRGQARLLASRAHVLGDGAASRHAADLLRRAGVQLNGAAPNVVVDLRVEGPVPPASGAAPIVIGRLHESEATVDALPGGMQPTRAGSGAPRGATSTPDPALHACTLRALGALAAIEALVLLLEERRGARRTSIDLASGRFTSVALETLA